ncbi:hypothetical protein MNBD_BACTEROID01-773 [hydrothermal vent metagenome]|uniref:Uncharacterized protein n=1 Tax=hydrothermal vent metagenome TaxID=652676 RepID=A0A3B0TRZ3_9ZZZZ
MFFRQRTSSCINKLFCKKDTKITKKGIGISNKIMKDIVIIVSEKGGLPLLRLSVMDTFSSPGDYDYLLNQNRLGPPQIATDILNMYTSNI